jgi:hypothetical protein
MNLLSLALGGLEAGSPGAPLSSSEVSTVTSLFSGQSPVTALISQGSSRDSSMSGLLDLSSSVNALQQAAAAQGGSSSAASSTSEALNLPPLPPMPAPAKPPAVPTDDHGQSNIVFSDADSDGALIH